MLVEARRQVSRAVGLFSGVDFPVDATMVGARLFNERRGQIVTPVYGAVTTGSLWKFLSLVENALAVDPPEYAISDPGTVVGTLVAMLRA